ncbi:hypothetical protein [Lentzea cavernae]|uniref:Uncharacterized protein n=1 Tax=Lentzea cavernae TaxID=2020703 RepID=A0ABQ3MXY5_9PSEU|nr:hypothetical protein [Lentzea cavernae]GHH62445.1 hypothetical protein GCM10017774_90210 [Lentzea cavernae]
MSDQEESHTAQLTPDDTWCMWLDSGEMRWRWATVIDERTVERDGTDTVPDEVLDWSVELTEDETGDRFTLDHNKLLATMERVVRERGVIRLRSTIVDQIAAVLRADGHDAATDELCQLDCVGFDAIVQIATLGEITYG